MKSMPIYWMRSSRFEAERGEDEETNPRLYGRQLANWLRERFLALGYPVEDVIPEDWGWCVMCQRDPYWLWIGCVNLPDYECAKPDDPPPSKEMLLWQAGATAEIPFVKYLFKRKPDVSAGLSQQSGTTSLGIAPLPSLEEIAANPEFEPVEISAEEFEAIWATARSA